MDNEFNSLEIGSEEVERFKDRQSLKSDLDKHIYMCKYSEDIQYYEVFERKNGGCKVQYTQIDEGQDVLFVDYFDKNGRYERHEIIIKGDE